jgi:hypothetical protein
MSSAEKREIIVRVQGTGARIRDQMPGGRHYGTARGIVLLKNNDTRMDVSWEITT